MARDDDIRTAFIRALGWDPQSDDEPPRVLLQWVAQRREREETRRKWRGTIILTIVSGVGAAGLGALAKEIIAVAFR